jgi:putative ABC transport system substrate-binding protein
MRRREFIAGLGGAAAWPLVARAQQQAVPVIGVLLTQSTDDYKIEIAAFLQSLKEAGYVAGQNVAVEYRYAEQPHLVAVPGSALEPRGVARSAIIMTCY